MIVDNSVLRYIKRGGLFTQIESQSFNGEINNILIVCCESVSEYDISLGDLITREPLLRFISTLFKNANITVLLKHYHYSLAILPKYKNVEYQCAVGNPDYKESTFHRKSYKDIFSITDIKRSNKEWNLIINSSSRDSGSFVRDLLQQEISYNFHYASCYIDTPSWFSTSQIVKRDLSADLLFKSHELFILKFACSLPNSIVKTMEYKIHTPKLFEKQENKYSNSCLIIDKSPVMEKNWLEKGDNPFNSIARVFSSRNIKVYVHRFISHEECTKNLPKYKIDVSYIDYNLNELKEFYISKTPRFVIGIDTGVMHYLHSIKTRMKPTFITVFTSKKQCPNTWSVPSSINFSTIQSNAKPYCKYSSNTVNIIEHINEYLNDTLN